MQLRITILAAALLVAAVPAVSAAGVQLGVSHDKSVGDYLTAANDRTLYLFEKDEDGPSTCYGACAQAWPPLVTDDAAVAGPGIEKSKLSTTKRKDGTLQVTYGGWPLYYFSKDDEAGDTYGQEVDGFGGEWYMVSPEGTKAEAAGNEEEEEQQDTGSSSYY